MMFLLYSSLYSRTFTAYSTQQLYMSLCCNWTYLSTKAFVLHLDESVYRTRACAALMRVRLQELLCYTWTCLSSRALMHRCLSVYKSCTCRFTVYNKCFCFVLAFFEKGLFVSVVSKHVRNTVTNRIIILFHETNRKTTRTD
jgi:hypothetical protein